jgi:hypothetical protein
VADVPIVVCRCGLRMRAPGAVPGRTGHCPSCGAPIRFPEAAPPPPESEDADDAAADGYGLGPAPEVLKPSSFVLARPKPAGTAGPARRDREGLMRPPERPEARIRDSFLYPFWGPTGVALLAFLPPLLWLGTFPTLGLIAMILSTMAAVPIAVIGLLPTALLFLPAAGFTLLFLGRVLVSSALGEVHHPRWPEWDLEDMLHGFGRWAWALLIGGVLGGFPATAYWLYCGDVDVFDAIILAELLAVGAVYGQMALLATLLHDDPLAANPITVIRSLWQVGWGCLAPSLVGGAAALVAAFALGGVLRIGNGLVAAVAFWAFWVLVLYEAMVVLRVLGLFYHRRAAALGWFRDRPRWGAGPG